ncbi:ribonuclease M5 [Hazenella sp. IB182357]|uniref:Ribonuclease M5 n=1 Tax=Polycladospora coralii TaxID=2771432 RepID=A0A926NB70_9BACL|nr:ribonuclease M5 [Polycladospora coralii]MBD1372475.1 ribonuclease M5 [Polycladospora coralii]MBS7531797.1 ribonuclease M5 [Polycladospora coralii]
MDKPKIYEVIVVEGHNDTQAIKQAVEADTIETRGSALDESTMRDIEVASKTRGVIIFTDPDQAGDRIRRLISEQIPNVKHAFLPQRLARTDKKVGIEHANRIDIQQALTKVKTEVTSTDVSPPLTWEEYISCGFTGANDSKIFRERVAEVLGIGYNNSKNFYRKLHVLQISRAEMMKAIEQARKGLHDDI